LFDTFPYDLILYQIMDPITTSIATGEALPASRRMSEHIDSTATGVEQVMFGESRQQTR